MEKSLENADNAFKMALAAKTNQDAIRLLLESNFWMLSEILAELQRGHGHIEILGPWKELTS